VSENRTKLIRIRVSEVELQALHQACERTGTKDPVELAREAIHYVMETRQEGGTNRDTRLWLREIVCRLTSLELEIDRLEHLLQMEKHKTEDGMRPEG
jgi:hypothetical protein